jgi:hypothetical protein
MKYRLIHILIGVLNQTMLERILKGKGYSCLKDWTNYRESDIFDFKLNNKVFDVKTSIIFSKFNNTYNRQPFTPELLIKNKSNQGPEWIH